MGSAIKSEFRKFFTTRLWWGMAIGIFVAGAVFAGFFGWALTSENGNTGGGPQLEGTATQVVNSVYTAGLGVGYLLLLTVGIMQIGSEYRHKTITATLLSTPKRVQAMLAKIIALLGIGGVYGLISLLGSVSVGAIVLTLRDIDPFPSTEVLRTLALSLLALGLWALIGLGVGILIPNQVAAILVGVGVAWIIEPLLSFGLAFVEWAAKIVPYFPSNATNSMVSGVTAQGQDVDFLPWWGGALVLGAYAVALSVFGTWRTSRQDIS
ncbi:ABC transporter permease [Knoellia sinensis KCTC 19936]|uniref:ABC transporter permease n=1 Tax=Knoellia sinensis KCTC 19936 TaxID=1385520 RepID=A0A0A0JDP4_9MICO|nr:ABC transporter permease subunit [Knoellia sinensis]KGN34919.1 ABC transporter permease [Knoellia sinensis KCTC 19936]